MTRLLQNWASIRCTHVYQNRKDTSLLFAILEKYHQQSSLLALRSFSRSIRRRSRTASVTAPVFSSSSPSSSPPSLGPSFSSLLSPTVGVCRRLVEAIAPAASWLDDDGVDWTETVGDGRGDNGKGKGIELALAVWWCTAQAAWQA